MNTLLVIIDVQNGFLGKSTGFIPDKIKSFLGSGKIKFDHIVATQFKNVDGSPYHELMNWSGLSDAESQKLDSYIEKVVEKVFQKTIYSSFTKEFELYIKENAIEKVYFCGIDTDCCVLKSAMDCFEKNIKFEVLANYCASNGGPDSHAAALLVMKRALGKNNINYGL